MGIVKDGSADRLARGLAYTLYKQATASSLLDPSGRGQVVLNGFLTTGLIPRSMQDEGTRNSLSYRERRQQSLSLGSVSRMIDRYLYPTSKSKLLQAGKVTEASRTGGSHRRIWRTLPARQDTAWNEGSLNRDSSSSLERKLPEA